MRVAFFSPMPPAKSGIADYSAALVDCLRPRCELTVFSEAPASFDPSRYDRVVYQIGNNGHHGFVYEEALRSPGVVVMHEANLHHLIADVTIKRGDWDAYLREAEFDGGGEALAYARRVRALEVGPDYDGVPMMRRLLEASRGAIAHSRFVEGRLREHGLTAPSAVIPHGAWLPEIDRRSWRDRLGLAPDTPLIGIFGFLKPYKRIPESLRAFRRLLRAHPDAKMILVGEPHPELSLRGLVESLGIRANVRMPGFTSIEEFNGYMAACDVVLNLRYPTVGETSGTLLRALGLGRATLVSDVGAFAEYPDEICLKVPVDRTEEDVLFEYLSLLVARAELRESLGRNAREWVARECSWDRVADLYLRFLRGEEVEPAAGAMEPPPALEVEPECVARWAMNEESRGYIETHRARLLRTLEITPRGGPEDRVLEMGTYIQITPALRSRLGYGEVRGSYYGPAGQTVEVRRLSVDGEEFTCDVDLFDAERDRFPYADEHFATVLCCELIEHLPSDPMHMMSEINRILRRGGHLVLTTPNITSLRALAAAIQGYHPAFFPAYIRPKKPGEEADARHNREYTPREIAQLLADSGFEMVRLDTGEFREVPRPEHLWVRRLLETSGLPVEQRGDDIFAVGRKVGPVRERYPAWLYD
jgi:glycosyltransferase involved in cell wall biosynthesis/SAM-dependent methyltransferase